MMNPADMAMAPDADLAYWLEMAEAFAYEDSYAAASKPGKPTEAATIRVGGAVAFGLTLIDFGFFNRVVGLGTAQPATETDVEAASRFFLDLGLTQSVIHVAPGAGPAELVPWANARGYVEGARWVKMWRRLEDLPAPAPSLRIEPIDASRAHVFGDVCATAFEMPGALSGFVGAPVGRTRWVHYLGFDGDTPVSTSAMYLTDGVAWLGYGATLEDHRGRGWQTAMLARRLQDARDLGCRLAITETGEETEKEPVNHSYRNMVRTGFQLAYARQNWVRLPGIAG
jgi:GNAT superfamily N-acetyltransferase